MTIADPRSRQTMTPEQVLTIEEASEKYLHGDLSIEAYEKLLNDYFPSTEMLLRALQENRGFVAMLSKWLRQHRHSR